MTPQEKIIALAKLDGWKEMPNHGSAGGLMVFNQDGFMVGLGTIQRYAEHYLTSYDAIIPLVQKECNTRSWTWEYLLSAFEVVGEHANDKMFNLLKMTPTEIADALLKAKGLM